MNTQGLYIARLLDSGLRTLATGAVLRQHTDLNGGQAFDDRVSDRMTRLVYLGEALAVDEPEVLLSHVRWLRDSYAARGVAVDEAAEGLTALRDELREELPAQAHDRVSDLLDQARTTLEGPPTALGQVQLADRAQALVGALVDADRERAIELALDELDEGGSISGLELELLAQAQREIGVRWQRGELDVSQEHLASRIIEEILVLVRDRMQRSEPNGWTAVVAPARGNQHDIATRIVAHHFERAGWTTLRVSTNLPDEELVRTVRDHRAHLVALSLTTGAHLRALATSIAALRALPETASAAILVGGPPFDASPDLWRTVGADGRADSPREAPTIGAGLVGG